MLACREGRVNLRELLSIPYLLEAEAVETEAGKWLVRLAYPELPDCTVDGFVVEDVLRELEQRRIEIIVGLVEEGRQPPVPRKPLATSDPLWTVRDLGLSARIAALLESATQQNS
jgi:hypothetical protein